MGQMDAEMEWSWTCEMCDLTRFFSLGLMWWSVACGWPRIGDDTELSLIKYYRPDFNGLAIVSTSKSKQAAGFKYISLQLQQCRHLYVPPPPDVDFCRGPTTSAATFKYQASRNARCRTSYSSLQLHHRMNIIITPFCLYYLWAIPVGEEILAHRVCSNYMYASAGSCQ